MSTAAVAPSHSLPSHFHDHAKTINSPHSSSSSSSSSKSSPSATDFQQLKQTHAQLFRIGEIQNAGPMQKLIAAYCRTPSLQSLDYALKTFNLLNEEHKCHQFTYNSLLRRFCSVGLADDALELFMRMLWRGVQPDRFTFPPLFTAFSKAEAFDEGVQLHGLLIKFGEEVGNDLYLCNSLIHFYAEIGDMVSAQRVFDGMNERNVVSWTSLIDGYARGVNPRKAVEVFDEMVWTSGILPNSVTMACVASACAKLQDCVSSERIHVYILEKNIILSTVLVNSLVDMYMKCDTVAAAERLFYECTDKNIVLWNTMISNYTRLGMVKESLAVFNKMLLSEVRPDRVTLLAVVSATAQVGDVGIGKRLHGYILRHQMSVFGSVSNSIIDMYMKCGELHAACRVFHTMNDKTVVSWNTLIAGYIRNGDLESTWRNFDIMPERDLVTWNTLMDALVQESLFDDAIEAFRAMQNSGLKPDRVTMASIASACGHLGYLDLAKWTLTYIRKKGLALDVKLSTALVGMFARCGDSKSATQLFDEIKVKDVSAWTAAIGAFATIGNGKQALEYFDEMIKQGIRPDARVFVSVLTACSHSGLVDDGRKIFESMTTSYAISPQVVHYGCMVDLLGRAGLLKEACDLIESMHIEPNDVVWGALLAASCVHHDIDMAEYAAKHLIRLAPDRAGIHVLLSNIYASEGRWKDAAKVRLSLKEKGVRKLPGCSSIEVDGVIHEFASNDESHPQMAQTSKMLEEVVDKLATGGYLPDLNKGLLDVDESEKEFLLTRHSISLQSMIEKL